MENLAISDVQITASTSYGEAGAAKWGRLHVKQTAEHQGAWRVRTSDANQWLQIDLGSHKTKVTRVATQGRHGSFTHWVEKYNLQYSDNGVNFTNYKEHGQGVTKVTLYVATSISFVCDCFCRVDIILLVAFKKRPVRAKQHDTTLTRWLRTMTNRNYDERLP